jgi:hypothetical protein
MGRDDTQVALLALTYQALVRKRCCCPEDVFEYADEDPSEMSWSLLLALELLTGEDWQTVERLSEGASHVVVARTLRLSDPLRAEVVLHSKYPKGIRSQRRWAAPLVARWDDVYAAMERLKDEGLATSHWEIELVASRAWEQITGEDCEAFEETCEDELAWH